MTRDPAPPPLPTPPPVPIADYAGAHRPCPGCGIGPLEEPSFTWWGGLVGHKILGVEQCRACRRWWVKGTAQPGGGRVTAYVVIGLILGVLISAVWVFYMLSI